MNSPSTAHPAPSPTLGNTIPFPRKDPAQKPQSKLEQLVLLEGDIRLLPSRSAIGIHAVNEPRVLLGFEQAFLLALNRRGRARMEAASSVASVEAHAPLVRDLCSKVPKITEANKPVQVNLRPLGNAHGYPHAYGLWLPFLDRNGAAFSGLLLARSQPWAKADMQIGERVAGSYALALRALSPPLLLGWVSLPRWLVLSIAVVVAALMLVPVNLSVLAPFEVVASEPAIVTSPLDGVISQIEATPNSKVRKGQVLLRLESTVLRAEAAIAGQKADVAESKLATSQMGAFKDSDLQRDVAIKAKELVLARAEFGHALDMLSRVDVRATRDGVLLYSSASDWIGKPVQVGERIMEIADPARVEFRIDLGINDAIALDKGNAVRLFLDAEPLRPRAAAIRDLSFHASPQADGQLSYRVSAEPTEQVPPPRIGFRGTAQISGEKVSLGFYLLRRPIAALRQTFGF